MRRPKHVLWKAALVTLALIIVALLLVIVYRDGQTQREQAIPIIAAELDRLPPAGGVSEAQRTVLTDPGRGPSINVVYPQVVSCSGVQAHYAQIAPAAGWQFLRTQRMGQDIIDSYSKEASGYNLVLSIDCVSDDSTSGPYGGYTLQIHG